MVDDHGRVVGVVIVADGAVELEAHRVTGRVQCLAADDDLVVLELLEFLPVAAVGAAEQAEQVGHRHPEHHRDGVLAVGGEDHVRLADGMRRAHLGGLLAEQRGPEAEFAVALQRGGLGVEASGEDHVAQIADEVVGAAVEVELAVLDPLAVRREELHHVLALTAHAASFCNLRLRNLRQRS